MAFAATTRGNRRWKAFLFLTCCACISFLPYLLATSFRLLPSISFALFLGTYGLSIVLRKKDQSFETPLVKACDGRDYQSLPLSPSWYAAVAALSQQVEGSRQAMPKRIAYLRESGPPELGGRAGRVSSTY